MAHLDSSTLATYNSLVDPHLQCYFSNERIRSHLKHAGLISRRGDIISDSEYRSKLARREHKKHVRQMLAENIVHRAIDMERSRQAELRRQFDVVAKAALVHSVKESRRRGGYSSGNVSSPNDMGILSMHSSWSQARPKSANQHQDDEMADEDLNGQTRIPRVQSAHVHSDHRLKHASKSPNRRQRYLNRPKSTSVHRSSSFQRSRSPTKPLDPSSSTPPCQIRMVYFGPHTKIDYDHSLFEPVDEIMVMQQHCGGENLIVYKANLKAGEEFTFNSRRHADYPLGLSLYVKGLIDSRISTCCEYKHRHGVRLGGERGHFAIVSVDGSKPCLKCRFDKQARLKQYADSPKETDEKENGKTKPIIISLPVSDKPKNKSTPVEIPVRRRSKTSEGYSEDFEGSDRPLAERKMDSTSSSQKPSPKARPIAVRSSSETSSRSTVTPSEESATKTWQITFHTSNLSSSSFGLPPRSSAQALLKFSFISANGKEETEQCEIKMNDFAQYFKTGRHDSFPAKLKNIGQPKQIRLTLELTNNDDDDEDEIQWHLDHIELIDPETQTHSKFPCKQWIRPFEEKLLTQSEESPKVTIRRSSSSKSSASSTTSVDRSKRSKPKTPTRSPSISSTDQMPTRYELIPKPAPRPTRRVSTDKESNDGKNKTHYRVIIYPSKDNDGEFSAEEDSRIFLRLNNQTKDSCIYEKGTKQCPSFQSGESQTFEMDFVQEANEQPTKLTIGFQNSYITAGKWKLDKIVLINTETNEHTTFPCRESLNRNDLDLRAEKTFQAQSDDEESTPRNDGTINRAPTPPRKQEDQIPSKPTDRSRSSTPERVQPTLTEKKITIQSPSVHSSENSDEEDNEYNRMFKRNAPENSSSRPKTRRGRQDTFDVDDEKENVVEKPPTNRDVWRPSSELGKTEPVDPLVGLDDLQDQTARSSEQKTQHSQPSSTVNNTEDHFRNWYPNNSDNDDDDN